MMRRIRQKGAFFTEYALILAFVTVVGVAFTYSDSSFAKSVRTIFVDTGRLLARAAGIELDEGNQDQKPGDNTNGDLANVTLADSTFEAGTSLIIDTEDPPVGNKPGPDGVVDGTDKEIITNIRPGKVEDSSNVSGLTSGLNLASDSNYKAAFKTDGLTDADREALKDSIITISSYYKDGSGKYYCNLSDKDVATSYQQQFKFDSATGTYTGLNDYAIKTNSNKDQFAYISFEYPDGADTEKISGIIKSNLTLNKQ